MGKRSKRGHARAGHISIGGHTVIGQAIPSRKTQNRQFGREEGQRAGHRLGAFVVAGDMQQGRAGFFQLARQQDGVKTFGRSAQCDLRKGLCHRA